RSPRHSPPQTTLTRLGRPASFFSPAKHTVPPRLGRLRQAPFRRCRTRLPLFGPLLAPRGHLQCTLAVDGRRTSEFSLEGLCQRPAHQSDVLAGGGVPATLSAPRPAPTLRPHSSLWNPGRQKRRHQAGPVSAIAGRGSAVVARCPEDLVRLGHRVDQPRSALLSTLPGSFDPTRTRSGPGKSGGQSVATRQSRFVLNQVGRNGSKFSCSCR